MDRIKKLCEYLSPCKIFADIGCDHGYCTHYMLKNNMCGLAIPADVSDKCLDKARALLKDYIEAGKCKPVCCFGLDKIDKNADLVLIAGMGGEEIKDILVKAYVPPNFVFQPMKNVKELREYLIESGAEIMRDDVFESGGKYYFVICGKKSGNKNTYTPAQLEFGKGNIDGALGGYLREELAKKRSYLDRDLSDNSRARILENIKLIEGVLSDENN